MTWVLKTPLSGATGAWKKILKNSPTYRAPDRCSHTRRRWRGGFEWDCLDCGEPVRDREEKQQATFEME